MQLIKDWESGPENWGQKIHVATVNQKAWQI